MLLRLQLHVVSNANLLNNKNGNNKKEENIKEEYVFFMFLVRGVRR